MLIHIESQSLFLIFSCNIFLKGVLFDPERKPKKKNNNPDHLSKCGTASAVVPMYAVLPSARNKTLKRKNNYWLL